MFDELKETDVFYYHKKLFNELSEKRAKERKEIVERLSKTQDDLLAEKKQLEKKAQEVTIGIKNIRVNLLKVKSMVGLWGLFRFAGGIIGASYGSELTLPHLDSSDSKSVLFFKFIFGVLCFLLINLLISENKIRNLLEENDIEKLKEELKKYKMIKKTIKEKYDNLNNKIINFHENYQENNDVYNGLDFEVNHELLDMLKKYIKK